MVLYITRGYIARKESRKYVKFIYRMLPIFTIIVFVFLVFFVEKCIRLELNLYDKPLVKLKVEEKWTGSIFLEIADIARFAPSSCNTEPW